MADAPEWAVAEICIDEEFVEGVGQRVGQTAFETNTDIAPAAADAVAFVFGADVKSADECDFVIAGQKLAVIAKTEAIEFQGIEQAHFSAGSAQRIPEVIGKSKRAEG